MKTLLVSCQAHVMHDMGAQMHEEDGSGLDEWPTTMRFSRRLGEAYRDRRYAMAIEGPMPGRSLADLVPRRLNMWLAQLATRTSGNRASDT